MARSHLSTDDGGDNQSGIIEPQYNGISVDPKTASASELNGWVTEKAQDYRDGADVGEDLYYTFCNDFEDWNKETFKKAGLAKIRTLRDVLVSKGVYIPKNNKSIAGHLVNLLQIDTLVEWPEGIEQPIALLAHKIAQGTQRMEENVEKATAINLELERIAEVQKRQIEAITPRRLFTTQNAPTNHSGPPPLTPNPAVDRTQFHLLPTPDARTNQDQPQHQPQLNTRPSDVAKQVSEIAKIYTEDQKYDGSNGSFDHKYTIFMDICRRVELPDAALVKAFPTMLKGLALDQYYTNNLSGKSLEEMSKSLRNFFEGPGYHRRNLDKWNTITLTTIAADYPGKTTYENVQELINSLRKLQYGLAPALRSIEFLHNKVVSACQGSAACRLAVSDPPAELGALINKLQSSIMTYEKEQTITETFFTDRRYHRQPDYDRRDRQDRQDRSKGQPNFTPYRRQKGACFICKKDGCRAWKHSQKEQDEEKAKFRARTHCKFNPAAPNYDTKFEKAYRQYIMDLEGDDDTDEDDFDTAFEALLMDDINQSEDTQENFFTSCGNLSALTATETVGILLNQACTYQLSHGPAPIPTLDTTPDSFLTENTSRYGSDQFYGIIIDTGAAKRSTAGIAQFQAYQRLVPTTLDERSGGKVTVQFGIGSTSSIGSTMIRTPIGDIEFHIMPTSTPFLLSLGDMDALGVYFNNLTNTLMTPKGKVPVVRRFGHSFLLWDTSLQSFLTESYDCFLTITELQRLHRRFGHPSVSKLQRVLERAGHDIDKEALEHLTKFCEHCQRHGRSPSRFRFNLRDDVTFNCSIIVDIFFINNKPVLHVVDEATRYQAGRWLNNMSAKTTWETLRLCWIDTYLGPPDQITTDAGKNFASNEFSQLAANMGTKMKIAPVEAHNSVGIVERYHGPVRRAYQIITAEIPGIDKDAALQMAFKAINDSVGPDGLVPTLLVYGAYPRMSEIDAPAPTVTQRAIAIKKAMTEISKLRAKRQVADALHTRNGPNTDELHTLVLNSLVLVWREGNAGQNGSWEGPYHLVNITGENCTLALPRGNTVFRTTSVKPYYEPNDDTAAVQTPEQEPTKRGRGRPCKQPLTNVADITVYLQDEQPDYRASRHKEVTGLLDKNTFEIATDVPQGTRIFKARFVDEIKNPGTEKAFTKSRLVVQAYDDSGKTMVLTQSPTIQRVSQRIILAITPMMAGTTSLNIRDISQAYVQSTTLLNRTFYIRPPIELTQELGAPEGSILRVVRPLYGVPEAGNHWFKTYHNHHTQALSMAQSTYDPCLLYSNDPFSVVGIQVDDTLILSDDRFIEKEQQQLHKAKFLAKDLEKLTDDNDLKFNGGIIHLETGGGLTITQERQCKNLKLVSDKTIDLTSSRGVVRKGLSTKEQYIAQRARAAYIASVCQPEATYDLSVAAQATDVTESDVKTLNKRLRWQLQSGSRGLRFVKLEKESLRLLAFTDASFANNKDLSSQIGYVLVLADKNNNANILHWSSIKCKRVTRSVLASELYGMAHGFDMGVSVKTTIAKILQIDLPLIVCTDSKSLFDCLIKLGTTQEKRLMIDVMCLRQAYERREITEVKWIEGDTNPADSMTKSKPSGALKLLIDTNKVQMKEKDWVERVGGEKEDKGGVEH